MIYGLTINNFSYKTLIIAVMVLYIILNRLVVYIKDRKEIACFTYIVEVNTREGSSKIRAFLDTGNELKEPITNLPVIIVEKDMLKNFNIANEEKLLIPYKVINGSTGYIEAFKPLGVKIVYDNKKEIIVNAVIGLCDGKLSDLNDYNALLSRGII
jgi:stage II sporulation protein GA (sporulation sigma-E factor processing peptidase)